MKNPKGGCALIVWFVWFENLGIFSLIFFALLESLQCFYFPEKLRTRNCLTKVPFIQSFHRYVGMLLCVSLCEMLESRALCWLSWPSNTSMSQVRLPEKLVLRRILHCRKFIREGCWGRHLWKKGQKQDWAREEYALWSISVKASANPTVNAEAGMIPESARVGAMELGLGHGQFPFIGQPLDVVIRRRHALGQGSSP